MREVHVLRVSRDTLALLADLREPGESDDDLVRRIATFYRNARSMPASPFGPMLAEPPNVPSHPPAPGPPPARRFS